MSPELATQNKLDCGLVASAEAGNAALTLELLAMGADPLYDGSTPLRMAASNGHLECVKMLLPISNPDDESSYALQLAARNGHAECLRVLIRACDPEADWALALRWAAREGQVECVRLLIPVTHSKSNFDLALYLAAENGRAECVEMLIPASNSMDENNGRSSALEVAALHGHLECVKQLLTSASRAFSLNHNPFLSAITGGQVSVAAFMLDYEPSLYACLNFPQMLEAARSRGHAEMATFLASVVERLSLSYGLCGVPARSSFPPRL